MPTVPDPQPAQPTLPRAHAVPAPKPVDSKAKLVAKLTHDLQKFLASSETIEFKKHREPEVSVLIVLWNKAYFTLRCLRALSQATQKLEIILVDNGSTDETAALLARVKGIRVIRNKRNEGFLLATNRAASVAKGRDLLLLNNDAFVRPGAIGAAISTLRSSDDIGAVGGRLVLADGTLQEAGSIIWSDGSTLGYLRGTDPEAGPAMFRRDVDYCSGALLFTPRAVWERLGGLDTAYAPAYYEEADYCMRLREAGLRVVYEPEVVADHFEFGSEAKPGNVVALSLRNRKILRKRHGESLLKLHLPPAPVNILVASCASPARRRRLLIVDDAAPLAALGAGFPRTKEIVLAAAAMGWFVTLYATNQSDADWTAIRREIPAEVEIIVGGGHPGLVPFLHERSGYYETIFVSRPHNINTVKQNGGLALLSQNGTRLIYDAEALFALREAERAKLAGKALTADEATALIGAEIDLCEGADAVSCVSPAESAVFRKYLGEAAMPVHVLSHAVAGAPGRKKKFGERRGFLFIGRLLEKEAPNWTGLQWFIDETWPLIREALPQASLTVVGKIHPDHEELLAPGVHVTGAVDDLSPLYDGARVFVAPIRYSAGVPIKVIEAAAAGVPCLGTRLMARQLNFTPGSEMMAEDDPARLARKGVHLHENEETWNKMCEAASRRINEDHSAEAFRRSLNRLLEGSA